MRHAIFAIALATAAAGAFAGDTAKPVDARATQQARMKGCNADAKVKALKGDERKAFMGECLKKKPDASRA